MSRQLSVSLHVLTARLDRAADRILRAEHGVSYGRFLALTLVGEMGVSTQRGLADRLGVTEPSVSRMVAVLTAEGLLDVRRDPGGGRRKRLELTGRGRELVDEGRRSLEGRFAALVEDSGVPYERYHDDTRTLLAVLDTLDEGGSR